MEVFTTDSSGIEYGLYKDHGKCDLHTAKSRIANTPMRDHLYSVHVVSVKLILYVVHSSSRTRPSWKRRKIFGCVCI